MLYFQPPLATTRLSGGRLPFQIDAIFLIMIWFWQLRDHDILLLPRRNSVLCYAISILLLGLKMI